MGGVDHQGGLRELQLERGRLGLGGVEGVGDRLGFRLPGDQFERLAAHAQLWADQHQG